MNTKQKHMRINEAIADCNRYIAKEEPRRADLRPADIDALLKWYYAHRAKLLDMLNDAAA